MPDKSHYKVLIIGSGPAGLTAAIYASRAQLAPLVVGGPQPGGQLTITTEVENFPGFPDGIQGPELMEQTRLQAEKFGTEYMYGEITDIDVSSRPFTIVIDDEDKVLADTLIVASGASARLLGLETETHLMGYGVSACATCDGFFFRDKEIAIVGGGDSALEEAIYLTRFATTVSVIHRRDELRASQYMRDKALGNEAIVFKWNRVVKEVVGTRDSGVTGLVLEDTQTGETEDFSCEGLFIAIGHNPNTALFKGKLDMDEVGYLVVHDGTHTNVPGVFAAGDVADSKYRQAITAAGAGCMAALDAEHFLAREG